jgi:hypothetical protein
MRNSSRGGVWLCVLVIVIIDLGLMFLAWRLIGAIPWGHAP